MPGYLLDVSSTVNCAHLPGKAMPNPPCATAQWTTGALRVKASGTPVLLQDSQSTCVPTGTPLSVMVVQARVKAK